VAGLDFTATPTVRLADGSVLTAKSIIAAVPPRLIASWAVTPELPAALQQGLTRWPTWMAAHAKFVARYETPFWREGGLSGSALSQRGPLMEVVDHSDEDAGIYALFGFVGWPAQTRQQRGEDGLIGDALAQLSRLFGDQARSPAATHLKDWASDPFTTGPGDHIAPNGHPPYGEPALQRLWFNDRLAIAGAEADAQHGGLIEGALAAADAAVERLGLIKAAA
jgi:monoamine oxidase